MNTHKVDDLSTYYKEPLGKNSQFIPKSLKEYPLRPVIRSSNNNGDDELMEAIFPMKEVDLKLFYLIQDHKQSSDYTKTDIKLKFPDLKEKYNDFYYSNLLSFKNEFEKKYEIIANLHKNSEIYKFQMTKVYVDKYNKQKEYILPKIEALSFKHKNEVEINYERDLEKENLLRQKDEEEAAQKSINQSSRNNVIVDEAKLEELMAKLDPLNKYRQGAANEIPEMIYNPMDLFMERNYQDVNSLVMNKTKWAELTTKDNKNKLHTFSPEEEKLFYEAFMLYPKEFGKISKHMKYMRTVEELIAYYYHTKLQKNYFGKYLKMKEDLEKEKEMKKQKKKSLKQQGKTSSVASPNTTAEFSPAISGKKKIDRSTNNTPIQQLKQNVSSNDLNNASEKNDSEDGHVKFSVSNDTSIPVENIPDIKDEISEKKPLTNEKMPSVADTPAVTTLIVPTTVEIAKTETSKEEKEPKGDIIQKSQTENVQIPSVPEKTSTSSDIDQQQQFGKKRKLSSEVSSSSETPSHKKISSNKTSYWSVHEAAAFPDLLRKHGKDWKNISTDIGTKSVTMIRNYYMKKGKELGFDNYVEEFIQKQKELGIEVKQQDDFANSKSSRSVSPIEQHPEQQDVILQKTYENTNVIKPPAANTEIVPEQKQLNVLPPLSQQLLNKRTSYFLPAQTNMTPHFPQPIKPSLELFPQQHQKQQQQQQQNQNSQLQPLQPKISHQLPPLALRKGSSVSGLSISSFDQQKQKQQNSVNLPPIVSYNTQATQMKSSFPLPQTSTIPSNFSTAPPINTYNNNVPIAPKYLHNNNQTTFATNTVNKFQYTLGNNNMTNSPTQLQTGNNIGTYQSYPQQTIPTSNTPTTLMTNNNSNNNNTSTFGRNTTTPLSIKKNIIKPSTTNTSKKSVNASFFDPLSALAAIASNEQKLMEEEENKKKK